MPNRLLCSCRCEKYFPAHSQFPKPKTTSKAYAKKSSRRLRFALAILEMRCVKEETHEDAAQRAGDGDSHDPGHDEQADTLEVDSLERAIAQADSNGGAGDAHRCGDGEGELREDQDGDGSAHLHGATTAGGVICDLVAHDYFFRLVS